jgi:cation diffusion facilitator CzcD-associated flavoprotein CzcO
VTTEWLIIGGGIHGTALSLYLTARQRIHHHHLRVLDAQPQPLALWQHFSANVGMTHLRSGLAHHLHFDPFSLVTFARTQAGAPLADFREPYARPALALFRAHTDQIRARYHLDSLRLHARAHRMQRMGEGWQVETDQGTLRTRRVLLCIGATEQPFWPPWSQTVRGDGVPLHHIFDPHFDRRTRSQWQHALVIGGGITAAQTALALALTNPGTVTLLMRHSPRIHQFDADLGWLTREKLNGFHALTDPTQRRQAIREARHRGSIPVDVWQEVEQAVAHGLLRIVEDEVLSATPQPAQPALELHLRTGATLTSDYVILATGFQTQRPGGPWIDTLIAEHGLPVAADGFPVLDQTLCWAPGLYACGALAELELGPAARNFAGIRLAADRMGAIQ